MKTKVIKSCPMCNDNYYISVDRELANLIGGMYLIQELFPELNATEREFLKSGYCPKCQKMLFGNGSTRKVRMYKEKKSEMFVIGRPINGISINGNEYVLDDNGDVMKFKTEDEARSFLFDNGLDSDEIEDAGIVIEKYEGD